MPERSREMLVNHSRQLGSFRNIRETPVRNFECDPTEVRQWTDSESARSGLVGAQSPRNCNKPLHHPDSVQTTHGCCTHLIRYIQNISRHTSSQDRTDEFPRILRNDPNFREWFLWPFPFLLDSVRNIYDCVPTIVGHSWLFQKLIIEDSNPIQIRFYQFFLFLSVFNVPFNTSGHIRTAPACNRGFITCRLT